jgi:transposase
MVILKRASGALAPARQGHLGGGKLTEHEDWVRARLAEKGDLTLDELCVELMARGVSVDRSTVSRLLHRLGLSHKKKPAGKRTVTPGDRALP